jgi:two-component system LytT family response regulator
VASDLLESAREVVFVTAYDTHAIRAFDLNALDYLLKPVEPERLARTLDRIRQGPATESPSETELQEQDSIFLRSPDRGWFIAVQSIRLLQSEGNYTRLFFDQEKPLISRSLNALAHRLPPQLFFRANRAQIINLRWIAATEEWFSGSLKVRLHDGTEVELSRRQSQTFRDRFSL